MKNKIVYSIFVVGIIGIGAAYFVIRAQKPTEYYENHVIAQEKVIKTVNVDATVQPNVYRNITVEVPLRIKSVEVDVNDVVVEDQVLLRLDRDAINAQIRNAQLVVERAEIAENQGRRKSSGLDSREILSLKKASEQARQMRNELYAQVKKTEIRAPISGIVTVQNTRIGEVATGLMMRIIDTKSLQLEALIPEVDIAKISDNMSVRITLDAYSDEVVYGHIQTVEVGSSVVQNSTYYKAIIAIDDIGDIVLRDGMHADVDIIFTQKEHILAVPRSFAQKDSDGYFVLTYDANDKVQKEYFNEGLIGDLFVVVRSGLADGQKVLRVREENGN